MKNKLKTPLDFLAIGESIVDFISTEAVSSLREAAVFQRYPGGSPANIAVNLLKLGGSAGLISKLGSDAFGAFIKTHLTRQGLCKDYLVMDPQAHTSLAFVSKGSATPDFIVSRDSDYKLTAAEVPEKAVDRAKIIHASTWPLSRQPSRAAVYKAFKLARQKNKIVSLDPNYSPAIWPDHAEAQQVLRDIYRYVDITKPSLDDARRFFGPGHSPESYIALYHKLGPKIIVLTMGKAGALISQNGRILGHLPGRPLDVVDVTGAGDAFWAGFLMALLDEHPLETCLLFAREVVEMKLATIGPLPAAIDRRQIYANLPNPAACIRPWRKE
ncbi:MAG TPA: sugar kinase [Chloroflexi bacterium]|nr:sugar kinase [Chloroflexota bacterium]